MVDDALQGVTEVVRGADLLESTARQILLQEALGYSRPTYRHLPLVLNERGEKLSKQTLAQPILAEKASENMVRALAFLGQSPGPNLKNESPETIVSWAIAHWNVDAVPQSNGAVFKQS